MAGDIHLTELLMPLVGVLTPREPRQHVRPDDGSDELSEQVDSTPWHEWLGDDHRLTDTGTIDACGCPVYHWSGSDHAKSATMHEGCENGHGVHIWSGTMQADLDVGEHLSRLQLSAALHNRSITEAAACVGIQLGSKPLTPLTDEDLQASADRHAAIGDVEKEQRFRDAAATFRRYAADRDGTNIGTNDVPNRIAGGATTAPTIDTPGDPPTTNETAETTTGWGSSGADAEDHHYGTDDEAAIRADISARFAQLPSPYEQELEDRVFDFSPQTQLIRDRARATRVSPWAALGTTILRGLLRVSSGVALPPLVGSGPAPLNMQLGIVGLSGKGKDIARHVVGYTATVDQGWDAIFCPPSGASLASLYVDWLPNADGKLERTQIRDAAWCDWSEVDTLTVTAKRGGNDLASQLRVAISGGRLGTDPKMERKQPITVEPNTYRIGVSFSVQYGQPTEALLAERDGGTLQRTLWTGAADPLAPRTRPAKPQGQLDILTHLTHGQPWLSVDSEVAEAIDEARWGYLSRDGDEDTREGHRSLICLRVAAWAALVRNSAQVTMAEWRWAEAVLTHSDRVYSRIVVSVRGLKRRDATEKGVLLHVQREAEAAAAAAQTEKLLDSLTAWGARQDAPFTVNAIKRATKTKGARWLRAQELADELVIREQWRRDGNRYWSA